MIGLFTVGVHTYNKKANSPTTNTKPNNSIASQRITCCSAAKRLKSHLKKKKKNGKIWAKKAQGSDGDAGRWTQRSVGPQTSQIGFDEAGEDHAAENHGRQGRVAGDVAVIVEQPLAQQRESDAQQLGRTVQHPRRDHLRLRKGQFGGEFETHRQIARHEESVSTYPNQYRYYYHFYQYYYYYQ